LLGLERRRYQRDSRKAYCGKREQLEGRFQNVLGISPIHLPGHFTQQKKTNGKTPGPLLMVLGDLEKTNLIRTPLDPDYHRIPMTPYE